MGVSGKVSSIQSFTSKCAFCLLAAIMMIRMKLLHVYFCSVLRMKINLFFCSNYLDANVGDRLCVKKMLNHSVKGSGMSKRRIDHFKDNIFFLQ